MIFITFLGTFVSHLSLMSGLYPLNPHCNLVLLHSVIQDVDRSSLEANYQSFASLMEQRLAELFHVAGRQGSQTLRSKRATTVGGYTVQVGVRILLYIFWGWGVSGTAYIFNAKMGRPIQVNCNIYITFIIYIICTDCTTVRVLYSITDHFSSA